jgi:hypothetical protein
MPDGISGDSRVSAATHKRTFPTITHSPWHRPCWIGGVDTSRLQRSKGDLMANDRNRTDEQYRGPASERESEPREERIRNGIGEDVRGVADDEDEDFEDLEDIEEDDDSDGSF